MTSREGFQANPKSFKTLTYPQIDFGTWFVHDGFILVFNTYTHMFSKLWCFWLLDDPLSLIFRLGTVVAAIAPFPPDCGRNRRFLLCCKCSILLAYLLDESSQNYWFSTWFCLCYDDLYLMYYYEMDYDNDDDRIFGYPQRDMWFYFDINYSCWHGVFIRISNETLSKFW